MDNPADLGPATEAVIQELIAVDGYASRDDVLRAGVEALHNFGWKHELVDFDKLEPDEAAWLRERIAEADADPDGGIPAEEVFRELRERYENWK